VSENEDAQDRDLFFQADFGGHMRLLQCRTAAPSEKYGDRKFSRAAHPETTVGIPLCHAFSGIAKETPCPTLSDLACHESLTQNAAARCGDT
jgi:hypothetical protein